MINLIDNIGLEICLFEPGIAGNVGNILRTCSCFGVGKVHIIMPCGFIFKDVDRASMDYAKNVEIIKHNSFYEFMQLNKNRRLIALTTKSTTSYTDTSYESNDTAIFGNESRGLPEDIMNLINHKVTIPMKPGSRSFNLAISAGIFVSEYIRQKAVIR